MDRTLPPALVPAVVNAVIHTRTLLWVSHHSSIFMLQYVAVIDEITKLRERNSHHHRREMACAMVLMDAIDADSGRVERVRIPLPIVKTIDSRTAAYRSRLRQGKAGIPTQRMESTICLALQGLNFFQSCAKPGPLPMGYRKNPKPNS